MAIERLLVVAVAPANGAGGIEGIRLLKVSNSGPPCPPEKGLSSGAMGADRSRPSRCCKFLCFGGNRSCRLVWDFEQFDSDFFMFQIDHAFYLHVGCRSCHSLFCSRSTAPINRTIDCSWGKDAHDVGLHEDLKDGLGQGTQKITLACILLSRSMASSHRSSWPPLAVVWLATPPYSRSADDHLESPDAAGLGSTPSPAAAIRI